MWFALPASAVSVSDTTHKTVVATIPVGLFPLGIAITPNGAFAYMISIGDDSVSVIDTATNVVAGTINIVNPRLVALTPDGAFAYVTSSHGPVTVIDTATNTVITSFAPPIQTFGIAFTPDGAFASVGHNNQSQIENMHLPM